MKLFWKDASERLDPHQWYGLRLDVSGVSKPSLSVATCHPRCLRMALGGLPILWARIEEDWYGVDLLRVAQSRSLNILPPVSFEEARIPATLKDEILRDRYWAAKYASALSKSKLSPLTDGQWHLGYWGDSFPQRELSPQIVQRVTTQNSLGYLNWDCREMYPVTLRNMSQPDDGRVKALRKLARVNLLPPVLLYWVSGLQTYLILDGHDRLHASRLENLPVSALALMHVQEHQVHESHQISTTQIVEHVYGRVEPDRKADPKNRKMSVDTANKLLLDAYTPSLEMRLTRADILTGGFEQWRCEVQQELLAQGYSTHQMLDA